MTGVDPGGFRQVLGQFCSGLTVITALADEMPVGMTCQSFFSLSLTPPLIAFAPATTSTTYPRIREAASFAINILAEEQSWVANQFATRGADKWAGVSWRSGHGGAQVIGDALASLECSLESELAAGDHFLVVGRVLAMDHDPGRLPLLYFRSSYSALDAD